MQLELILNILNVKDNGNINDILNSLIIYLRKSRKDMDYFKDESIEKTLQRHEKELQDWIIRLFGSPIPEKNIYREVASGDTIEDRPVMQEVLNKIEDKNIRGVVCIEIERLARGNSIDQGIIAQTFKYTNTKILTPMKIYDLYNEDDLSYFEDGLFQARKYLKYTKRILNRGRLRSVKEGKYIGSITPYGYDKEKLKNEKGFKLIINKSEAAVVKLISKLWLNGLNIKYNVKNSDTISSIAKTFGITKEQLLAYNPNFDISKDSYANIIIKDIGPENISNYLNYLNIKGRKNDVWTGNMVRNILLSYPIYGYLTWNRRKTSMTLSNGKIRKSNPINGNFELVRGLHEPILSEEERIKTLEKFNKRKVRNVPLNYEIKNPLVNLVKCGYCNRKMTRRPYYSRNGKEAHADTLLCRTKKCKCVSSQLDIIESRIIEELKKELSNFKLIISDYEKENDTKNINAEALSLVESEINKINAQLEKAYELVETGVYSKELYLNRTSKLNNKMHELLIRKKELTSESEIEKNINSKKNSIPIIENILKNYNEKLTPEQKNKFLKSILEEVIYYKEKGGRKYYDTFKLKLKFKSIF